MKKTDEKNNSELNKRKKKTSKIFKVLKVLILLVILVIIIATAVIVGTMTGIFGDDLKID